MSITIDKLPVSSVVKEATQSLHTDVENLLLPKLSSIHSQSDYAAILRLFYGYFFPLETIIHQHITAEQLPDIAERRKAAAIIHDLHAIGYPTGNITRCTQLPVIENTSQAFGALYVLEGSTLGGKMIAKMLRRNGTISLSDNALTFFSGYKEETGAKWKCFLDSFNQQRNTDEIVESANETFYHLKSWIQHVLYHD